MLLGLLGSLREFSRSHSQLLNVTETSIRPPAGAAMSAGFLLRSRRALTKLSRPHSAVHPQLPKGENSSGITLISLFFFASMLLMLKTAD